MPLTAMISSISSEQVAGPIVAMILVRLVLLKPAMVRCTALLPLREYTVIQDRMADMHERLARHLMSWRGQSRK